METYGKENISTPNRHESSMTSSTSDKPAPMRPLTAAYQAARSDHQVLNNIHDTTIQIILSIW